MQRVPLQWHFYSLCHFIYAASVKVIYIIQWLNLKLILWVSSWASHGSSLWLLQPVLFSLSANQKGYLTFKLYPAGKRDLLIVIFSKVIWNEEIKGRNVIGGSRKPDSFAHSTVIHAPAQKASKIHFLCIAKDGDRNEPQRTVLINKIKSLVQYFGIWQGESEPHVSKVQLWSLTVGQWLTFSVVELCCM